MADESNTTAPAASSAATERLQAAIVHLATGPRENVLTGRTASTASRRTRWSGRPRRRTQVFPAQEGLQILRRKNRHHQLQRRADAGAVRGRERQDRAAPSDRGMHASSAAFVLGHQAGPQHCLAAVCRPRVVRNPSFVFGRGRPDSKDRVIRVNP